MLKILKDKWAKNSDLLFKKISEVYTDDFNSWGANYSDLVKLTFDVIYNDGNNWDCDTLDVDRITEVDDGNYMGTLLFLIPFRTYEPSEGDYLMTYIGYGSCTVCDAFQNALCLDGNYKHRAIFAIAKDLITNAIKPYNHGWRYQEGFEQVVFEEGNND